jgi:hypothetical protein
MKLKPAQWIQRLNKGPAQTEAKLTCLRIHIFLVLQSKQNKY